MTRVLPGLTAATLAFALTLPAAAQSPSRVQSGNLECLSNPTVGAIIGSVRTMTCVFKPVHGPEQHYSGTRARIGIDIGVQTGAAILWSVLAPTSQLRPGELEGTYAGVSADVAAGLGLGANVLVGGSNNTIALQPLSVEGQVGVGVALGASALTLTYLP
jgi:hypothetical protein